MASLQTHTVSDDEDGIRLDRWFKRHFADLTHGNLQKMLRTGQIRLDGRRADAADRLVAGQAIRVPPQVIAPPPAHIEKQSSRIIADLRKMILFEDEDVIVLNKPPGLAVQGGTGLKENLDDMLVGLQGDGKNRPKLVHRLDRDTSGVLLIARTPLAATRLTESFRHRDTQKIYWALTVGVPRLAKGRISAPLVKQGEIMQVDENDNEEAKSALTLYQVVESMKKEAAFVALYPVTGRTHQLRVHMTYSGTPILGDRLYGVDRPETLPMREVGKGLHLHARRLIIPHPRHGVLDVVAPLGAAMQKTWKWFGFDPCADVEFTDA